MESKISLKEIINNRLRKLEEIVSKGINPYPYKFVDTNTINSIISQPEDFIDQEVKVSGRIISLRKMGKVSFINIANDHSNIQIYTKMNNLKNTDLYNDIVKKLDIGDFIGVVGSIFYTKTEELSVNASDIMILCKSIRPLPNLKEKDGKVFFKFDDKELRYRNRHLDLIANVSVKNVFILRSKIISNIRSFLDNNNYLEVETPILQPLYGGANARPFKTHHNSLDQDFYLRIADELYLKRLIIGGLNKVYEISKNFRNEGMDRNHNPEFTMLEFYCAYSDVYDMMSFTEELVKNIAKEIKFINSDNLSFKKKFEIFDYMTILTKYSKINFKKIKDEDLYQILVEAGVKVTEKMNYPKMLDKAFSFYVEPKLQNPSFVINYPLELSPLAKISRESNNKVERFELFILGMEIANSFSELNDPIDQINRMKKQNKLRDLGDEEAQVVDYDFIEAMEYGMPPCGGVGLGIDRLVMLLTNQSSIKDVILFPTLKSREE